MPKPIKATKTTKNQSQSFRESLAMPMPSRTTVAAPSKSQMRVILWVIWALATIAAGIGVGRLIRDSSTVAGPTEAPVPVAQATIHQPAATIQTAVAQPARTLQPNLVVKPGAQSVTQAGAGNPAAVLATSTYQPASDPDSLQPGFTTEVRIQGQIGTQSVR